MMLWAALCSHLVGAYKQAPADATTERRSQRNCGATCGSDIDCEKWGVLGEWTMLWFVQRDLWAGGGGPV